MAITYEWSFPSLDVNFNEIDPVSGEPVQNVVTRVNWALTGRDGVYSSTKNGTVSLPPPGVPFVNYNDLTPEIVQGWVEGQLGLDNLNTLKLTIETDILEQQNPTYGELPPPWG